MLYKNFSSMACFFENLALKYGECAMLWHVGDYSVTGCHIPEGRDSHFVTY